MSELVNFSGVEELEHAAQALGWNIEYRQLGKGSFTADFSDLEHGGIYLSTEKFNNHLQVKCEPPEGFFGIFLPRLSSGHSTACEHAFDKGDIVAFSANSELEIVTRGEIRNETVFLEESQFRKTARALVPSSSLVPTASADILTGNATQITAIAHDLGSLHGNGSLDSETISNMLARIILWMDESTSSAKSERFATGRSVAVARLAQSYIEENYSRSIRMQDLCVFTKVSLRTLQRCFATHFQITPTQYIKARRLNAARRALSKADPEAQQVTRIAMLNGFTHLGRFSTDYRKHFGEAPSETLAVIKPTP